MMTMEEMLETALRLQPIILAEDKRDGAPLSYRDEQGRLVTENPDGSVTYEDLPSAEGHAECLN